MLLMRSWDCETRRSSSVVSLDSCAIESFKRARERFADSRLRSFRFISMTSFSSDVIIRAFSAVVPARLSSPHNTASSADRFRDFRLPVSASSSSSSPMSDATFSSASGACAASVFTAYAELGCCACITAAAASPALPTIPPSSTCVVVPNPATLSSIASVHSNVCASAAGAAPPSTKPSNPAICSIPRAITYTCSPCYTPISPSRALPRSHLQIPYSRHHRFSPPAHSLHTHAHTQGPSQLLIHLVLTKIHTHTHAHTHAQARAPTHALHTKSF
mmetsp:Transcript_9534/g.25474  ORF Transcript_9534/g.25474 Transcript_9534/m.25474 type:complete len:275 (+) Transcript_9534:232-1056(+)